MKSENTIDNTSVNTSNNQLSREAVTTHLDSYCFKRELIRKAIYSYICLLYTSPSPRDRTRSRMPSSA